MESQPDSPAARIVILGGGFAGAYCAQALEPRLTRLGADVLLINRTNYFLFTPLLIEASTGTLEPRHAVVSLRRFVRSTRLVTAEVEDVDLQRRRVRYRPAGHVQSSETPWDHLAICLGSVTLMPPVPGLREHGFELKNLADGIGLRDRMIQMLELAEATDDPELARRSLSFVIVGGNYTGVELAGECHDLLHAARRHYRRVPPDLIRVTLVELRERILPTLDEDLARFAADRLSRRGIDIRLGATIQRIEPDRAQLADGTWLPTSTVIWAAGIAPNPLVARIGLPTDERGYIRCDDTMRVQGHDNVWAIGDCAVNPDPRGGTYPATAQHATRQGAALAANMARAIQGRPPRPVQLANLGSVVALGRRSGVAKIFGLKLAGFPAWFLWRTIYLWKMPGLGRTLRVMLDWTVELILPGEHVQLGLHRPRQDPPSPPAPPDPQ